MLELFLGSKTLNTENYRVYYMYKKGLLKVDLLTYFNYSFREVYDEIKAMLEAIANDISGISYKYLQYDVQLKYLRKKKIAINESFGIDGKTNLLINSYLNKPMKYLDKKNIVINGKLRTIISYKGNSFGNELRKLHEQLVSYFLYYFKFSENAYAYIKGKSIQQCLEKHKNDHYFIKIDIENFFNSISKVKLNTIFRILLTTENVNDAKKIFKGEKIFTQRFIDDISGYQKILSACCLKNKVSLGFCSSPIISNIYMILFDALLEEELSGLHYSRYADDILISSDKALDNIKIMCLINKNLSYFNLKLNEKKVHYYHLKKRGDHVKFLGINIVKCVSGNKLTIGRNYLMQTSKMVYECLNDDTVSKDKTVGRIEFIKHSSNNSYEKLLEIIKVKMDLDFDLEKFKRNELTLNKIKYKEFIYI